MSIFGKIVPGFIKRWAGMQVLKSGINKATEELQKQVNKENESMQPKTGYKTTEFWALVASGIVNLLMASGVFNIDGGVYNVLVMVSNSLAAVGYAIARSLVKKG